MYYLEKTALVLLIIGGLNWGFIGIFGFNPIGLIFGGTSLISRLIYALVGISAVGLVWLQWHSKNNEEDKK